MKGGASHDYIVKYLNEAPHKRILICSNQFFFHLVKAHERHELWKEMQLDIELKEYQNERKLEFELEDYQNEIRDQIVKEDEIIEAAIKEYESNRH